MQQHRLSWWKRSGREEHVGHLQGWKREYLNDEGERGGLRDFFRSAICVEGKGHWREPSRRTKEPPQLKAKANRRRVKYTPFKTEGLKRSIALATQTLGGKLKRIPQEERASRLEDDGWG